MSTTTCFCREIRKILCGYPLLSVAMPASGQWRHWSDCMNIQDDLGFAFPAYGIRALFFHCTFCFYLYNVHHMILLKLIWSCTSSVDQDKKTCLVRMYNVSPSARKKSPYQNVHFLFWFVMFVQTPFKMKWTYPHSELEEFILVVIGVMVWIITVWDSQHQPGCIIFTLFGLTHCSLNELPHSVYWKILILSLGMSDYVI